MPIRKVFIGFDGVEIKDHLTAAASLHMNANTRHDLRRLSLDELTAAGIYTRKTETLPNGQLWDDISQAPMSTGHAIGRFFVPYICNYEGWALFTDGDVLFRSDIEELFALRDEQYAVMCVQHAPMDEHDTKKGGHIQMPYARKNWSSVMLFNCGHKANRKLDLDTLNTWPGRDLHAFKWLADDQIGALPAGWNYLVGAQAEPEPVHLVHYTLGSPAAPDHVNDPYADEWRLAAKRAGYKIAVPA
jgi:hypothetical protein